MKIVEGKRKMSEQYQGYYGSGEEKIARTINGKPVEVRWNWTAFQTTKDFPVDDNLLNWVIGQETAIQECSLCLDEWARKISYLHETEWYKTWRDPNKAKSAAKSVISPGPYLLLLGDPGTGKSLLGKALSAKITEMYKEMNLKLSDIMCWKNPTLPSQPKTSMHDAGDGRKILQSENRKETQSKFLGRLGMKTIQTALIVFGVVLLAIGFYFLFQAWQNWSTNALLLQGQTLQQAYNGDFMNYMMVSLVGLVPMTIVPGGSLIFFGIMIGWLSKALGGSGQKGIGGAKQSDCPKLIVDNSAEQAPFVDATGHRSSQLFGCFDEKTRIFTTDGFKTRSEAKIGDLVLSLDPQTEEITLQPITDVWQYDYTGTMIGCHQKKGVDFLATPKHNFLYRPRKRYDKTEKAIQIAELSAIKGTRWFVPTRGKTWTGTATNLSDDLLELVGWYVSEGSRLPKRRWFVISQKTYKEKVQQLLDRMQLKYHYQKNGDFVVRERRLYSFIEQFGANATEKTIPRDFLNISLSKLQSVFRGLMLGNGNKRYTAFYTTSPKLRDAFIELAIKLGYSVTLSMDERNPEKWNTTYCINISKKEGYINAKNLTQENYNGKIWCVTVPNHSILIERNGKMFFCSQSVAWDPYQTGGLGTPEHQRVSAGDVHVASLGILFIDEIKNLDPEEAVTLLSVLEDGQLPITMRGRGNGGDTAAMAVSTEPVPAIDFLVAAGNFDSIGLIHPALMDRIYGYGKVVRMNNDMPNTEANRRRYVQFIAQEVKRFNLIPFSREACIEVTEEGRRRSGKNDALSVRFRGIISIIKTAATLAMNQKCDVVEVRHVKEALSQHCKTIQRQLLENQMAEQAKMLEIDPQGAKHGQIYGLAVVSEEQSQEMTGSVLNLKASMTKIKFKNGKSERSGSLTLTGGVNEKSMMADSSAKVRNVILQKYGVDIAQDYITHIDYSQSYGVDGPSAGVTMTILLSSLIEGKAIRQDVAVTGEINLSVDGKINITAVGGVHEKIKAAEAWGFKRVIIPQKNYEHSIVARDYRIEVLPAETLDDYLKICLVDKPKE
jgi:lon-related putative ATP-dependent protease